MEISRLILRSVWRIAGFVMIFSVGNALTWLFVRLPLNWFVFFAAISFWITWQLYNRLVGELEGDVAILIRLLQIKTAELIRWSLKTARHFIAMRHPIQVAEYTPEIAKWADVEQSQRVRRMLRRGRMTVLLGQMDGEPRMMDLADIGKVYITAPDRSGKTNLIQQMITSILLGHPLAKRSIDFVFIDMTGDLAAFRPLGRYTANMSEAVKLLTELGNETMRRNALRERHNLAGGMWYEIPSPDTPKTIVLVVDESIQVLREGGDPLRDAWRNLIQTGWKNGVLMITTSLYTRSDLIPADFTNMMRGKICGWMGGEQAWINVLQDYYRDHRQALDAYVNQKFRFALCVRPNKPVTFQPIFVERDRMMALVQDAAINIDDWREVVLMHWWNSDGMLSANDIVASVRAFLRESGSSVREDIVHKRNVLEVLRLAVLAGIADYNGPRMHYTPNPTVTSYGKLCELWDAFVVGGGLNVRPPTGEDMTSLNSD